MQDKETKLIFIVNKDGTLNNYEFIHHKTKEEIENRIKEFNKTNEKASAKIVEDALVFQALTKKETLDSVKSNRDDVIEAIRDLQYEIDDYFQNIESAVDRMANSIRENEKDAPQE